MSINSNTRDTNVRPTNTDPPSKSAPARSVQHMSEIHMFAAEVGDEQGTRRQVMAFRVGNVWYHDPAGEQWLGRLRPIESKGWLASRLEERFQAKSAKVEVPQTDTVNIMDK